MRDSGSLPYSKEKTDMFRTGIERWGEKLLLRLHRAEFVAPAAAPGLHGLVSELARRAGTEAPAVYSMLDPAINAFTVAMSRSRGCIALTTGLVQRLDREELAAVLAHQFSQLRSGHAVRMTFAGLLTLHLRSVGCARSLAAFLPILFRWRKFDTDADEDSVKLLGDPMPLIRALEKTEAICAKTPFRTADAATAPLFFLNPTLPSFDTLFAARVERLRQFAFRPVLMENR